MNFGHRIYNIENFDLFAPRLDNKKELYLPVIALVQDVRGVAVG